MDGGNGCTTGWLYLIHWSVYLTDNLKLFLIKKFCYVYFATIKIVKKKKKEIKYWGDVTVEKS